MKMQAKALAASAQTEKSKALLRQLELPMKTVFRLQITRAQGAVAEAAMHPHLWNFPQGHPNMSAHPLIVPAQIPGTCQVTKLW
jgi:hypothetical protein